MISLTVLSQVLIGALGVASVFLVTHKAPEVRKLASPVALLAEPAWIYSSYTTEQWGILLLTAVYTFRWSQVAYRDFWRNKVDSK